MVCPPIVEPEVLMDGGHTIEVCADVTARSLQVLYSQLADHKVYLEGTISNRNHGSQNGGP